jgi:hypothetical protein
MTSQAEQGRALLAEWKAEHRELLSGGSHAPACRECYADWPCPTARLIAAVEEAVRLSDARSYTEEVRAEMEGMILAKLADR